MPQVEPDPESQGLEEMDVEEVITLSENRFSTESRTAHGWTQTDGMLDRRLEQVPIASDRRQTFADD